MTQREDIVRDRGCGGCTMCCKLLSVEELETPPLSWCPHCATTSGCTIYADRPTECRQFYCEYLLDAALGEHWRMEPYHSDIRRWARAAARKGLRVVVWADDRKIVIAADRPALGEMGQFAP
jgi:hypothetical protein